MVVAVLLDVHVDVPPSRKLAAVNFSYVFVVLVVWSAVGDRPG